MLNFEFTPEPEYDADSYPTVKLSWDDDSAADACSLLKKFKIFLAAIGIPRHSIEKIVFLTKEEKHECSGNCKESKE